jgi:hypothetical protein
MNSHLLDLSVTMNETRRLPDNESTNREILEIMAVILENLQNDIYSLQAEIEDLK